MSDQHNAAAAYAVDALTSAERAEFESHLDGCSLCQSEVGEYAETLADLAPLVATAPPAALRARVMAAVADLRQEDLQRATRPAERAARAGSQGGTENPRRVLASVTELRPLEPHEVAPLEEHPSVVPDMPWLGVAAVLSEDTRRRSRWRDRVVGGLLVAALVAAVAVGAWLYDSRQQAQEQVATVTADAQRETELLTAADSTVHHKTINGTAVSFVVSRQLNQALFVARDLPALENNSIYQLWILHGTVPISAGVIRESGAVRQMLTEPLNGSNALALSIEPGPLASKTPTGQPYRVSLR